jgi:hypothetical protein
MSTRDKTTAIIAGYDYGAEVCADSTLLKLALLYNAVQRLKLKRIDLMRAILAGVLRCRLI